MLLLSSFELSVFMFLFYDSQFTIFVHLQSYEWKKTRGLSCSKRKFSGLFNFGNYALSGASFISTGIHITLVVAIVTLCQWPEWGDLHFYYHKQYRNIIPFFGVNALNGATSISTQRRPGKGLVESQSCQCPEWGDLHFYWLGTLKGTQEDILCQCPEWGDLHFYAYLKLRKTSKRRSCVNALNGATSISTKTLLSEISETQNVSMP